MNNKYLIVDTKVVPEYFEKVIEARELLKNENSTNISEVCKRVGISRSTYYKYKDLVFLPREKNIGRKALISLMLMDKKGILCKILDLLSTYECNIITINQNIPINNMAHVIISLDISESTLGINDIISKLGEIEFVSFVKLITLE